MYSGEFKNIDARTMKEFQAFTTDQMGLQDYVCFPVYQFGKLKFIEGRLSKSIAGKPKYFADQVKHQLEIHYFL